MPSEGLHKRIKCQMSNYTWFSNLPAGHLWTFNWRTFVVCMHVGLNLVTSHMPFFLFFLCSKLDNDVETFNHKIKHKLDSKQGHCHGQLENKPELTRTAAVIPCEPKRSVCLFYLWSLRYYGQFYASFSYPQFTWFIRVVTPQVCFARLQRPWWSR